MADGNGIWIYCQTDKATYCYHSSPTMLYGALVITEKTAVAECMSLKQKFFTKNHQLSEGIVLSDNRKCEILENKTDQLREIRYHFR